jgi:hypothetical protein
MYHDFRRKEQSNSTVPHFQLKCTKHDSFLAVTTNFWNCKICFLLCWHLLCYSSSNNHAYSMSLYESVTPKSCPNKISNAVYTHLLTSEMIIFIDTDMLLCLWPVIQFFNPVSRLGHFAICVHYSSPTFYSSHFRNEYFYRNRHSIVSVACYAVLQPCF